MKKLVSLLIICASVVGATVSAFAYSDTDNSSYKSSIDELSQLGIINGFEDGTFKPQENVTRAQAATMFAAARLLGHEIQEHCDRQCSIF